MLIEGRYKNTCLFLSAYLFLWQEFQVNFREIWATVWSLYRYNSIKLRVWPFITAVLISSLLKNPNYYIRDYLCGLCMSVCLYTCRSLLCTLIAVCLFVVKWKLHTSGGSVTFLTFRPPWADRKLQYRHANDTAIVLSNVVQQTTSYHGAYLWIGGIGSVIPARSEWTTEH